MTAINHALTGATIGLIVANPVAAPLLAFVSHFVCDAIPHYDQPGNSEERIKSKRFFLEQIVGGALLCFLLVVALSVTQPRHWLLAAICAFLAASPDLFWIPRWLQTRKTGRDSGPQGWFLRLHHDVQWLTGPKFIWLEAVWLIGCVTFIANKLT